MHQEVYLEKTQEEIQSRTIDWLRFPLIIGVVFIHMNPVVDVQNINYFALTAVDCYKLIVTFGSHVVSHIGVPCFFLFSGFLFFYKTKTWNHNVYLKKIKRRIKTLVVPYLLWNLIAVFVLMIQRLVKMDGSINTFISELIDYNFKIFWNYNEWGIERTNILGWKIPSSAPYNIPLWFLRDLIVTAFLSPLIYYFVKWTKFYGILLLATLYYTRIWPIIPGFSITTFFFFSLGAYFSIFSKNMVISLRTGKFCWYFLATVSMLLTTYYDGSYVKEYFYPIYVLTGVISAINIASYLIEYKGVKPNNILSKATFFIFATHMILLLAMVKRGLDKLIKFDTPSILLIKYLTAPLLTISICLCLYLLMTKFTPKMLNLLTGSR